jgi:hypothetical protein
MGASVAPDLECRGRAHPRSSAQTADPSRRRLARRSIRPLARSGPAGLRRKAEASTARITRGDRGARARRSRGADGASRAAAPRGSPGRARGPLGRPRKYPSCAGRRPIAPARRRAARPSSRTRPARLAKRSIDA